MKRLYVDTEFFESGERLAAAAGVPEATVVAGLMKMWAWCVSENKQTVAGLQLRSFFGPQAQTLIIPLTEYGFLLAQTEPGDDFPVNTKWYFRADGEA